MVSRVVSVEFTSSGASRVTSAMNQIESSANRASGNAATAFEKGTSRISSSLNKLGNAAGAFGVPFASGLGVIGASLDKTSEKAKGFGSTISKIGGVELLAGAAGLAFLGKSAVSAAEDFDTSHARLVQAVHNTGQSFGAAAGGVEVLDEKFNKLGFDAADTENSLSRLTAATRSVTTAQQYMGLAADIARARNIDLSTASDLLSKAQVGNYLTLRRLGIASKEQIASFHSMADVVAFLSSKFGGQAQAYAGTFQGKLDALKASANELQVTLGSALIPKIESLASSTVAGVQGFENLNRGTGGFLGKAVALGAAVPIAIFAFEKATGVLDAFTVSEEAAAAGAGVLGTSLSTLGVASLGAAAGLISFTATKGLLDHFVGGTKPNVDQLTTSFKTLAEQGRVDSVAADDLGTHFQRLAGDIKTAQGSTFQKGFGLSGSSHQAVNDINAVNDALKNLITTGGATKAAQAATALEQGLIKAGVPALTVYKELDPALQAIAQALEAGTGALDGNTAAANQAAFAYEGLSDKIKTTKDALVALNAQSAGSLPASTKADQSKVSFLQSVDALNNPQSTSSSGGGSGETATAAAIDQTQKELTLRDALLGVGDAARGVTTAEEQLASARTAQNAALAGLWIATQNYRTVLQGVAKDSQAAKDATDALAQAQNNAAGAKLDVADAKRRLEQAKNDRALLHFAVVDARNQLNKDLASKGTAGVQTFIPTATGSVALPPTGATQGASAEQIAKDRIALKDAEIAESGAADTVKRAQLDLSNAQLRTHQTTTDLSKAQYNYNGTLHGFAQNSIEAITAQQQLTTAQQNAQQAADQVATAQRGLTTAINNQADAALNLRRAQADVAGQLNRTGNAATTAGNKFLDLQGRIDSAKNAGISFYQDAGAAAIAAGKGLVGFFSAEIGALETVINTSPLLAAAFDPILQTVKNQLALQLQHQIGNTGADTYGGGTHPGPQRVVGPGAATYGGGATPGPVRQLAVGGPMQSGELAVVGEHGPELFRARTAGEIVPASSLARSVPYGGGVTYNINVQSLDPHTARDLVIQALREHTNRNGSVSGVRVSN